MASLSFIDPILRIGRQMTPHIPGLKFLDPLLEETQKFLGSPGGQTLVGAGLLGGGAALDKEPGEVLEARQFLRNRFTSPTALADQFSTQIGGLSSQFQPLLTQQRQRGIEDISQRFAAAFPTRVGAQGPEFGTLGRYLTNEALPREQALLGDIGLHLLNAQERAAGRILETSKPDPTAQALSQLGGLIASQALLGNGHTITVSPTISATGGQATGGAGGAGGGSVTSGRQIGQLSAGELARQLGRALTPQEEREVSEAIARGITSSGTQIGGEAIPGTAGIDFGLSGAGLLGPAGLSSPQALLSTLGSAGAGFGVGTQTGTGAVKLIDQLGLEDNRFAKAVFPITHFGEQGQAAAGGALGGAASGFALGGPTGAAVGAIAGAIGGFTSQRHIEHVQKAERRATDLANSRSNFGHIAAFWTQSLGAAGGELDRYQQFVDQQLSEIEAGPTTLVFDGETFYEDQEGHIARAGADLTLASIQRQNPSITSLDQIPGFRKSYIDYLASTITGDPGGFIQAADRGGL